MVLFHTLICICIRVPVGRQYMDAIFEMTKNDRKRVATDFDSLTFICIGVKGFSLEFGKKVFTGFKMPDNQSYTSTFSHILLHKRTKNFQVLVFQGQWRFFDQI